MARSCFLVAALFLRLAAAVIPAKEAGVIAGGLVEGFIGATDVKACVQRTVTTMEDLEGAVKDFEKKDAADVLKGLKLLADAVKTFPDALRECKAVESDIAQIRNALKQLSSPSSFSYHVAKDLMVNGANIIHEITTAVSDYRAQKWEDFGIQVGTALHKIIVGAKEIVAVALPAKEVGEIAGGLVEGFIGATDVKACVQRTVTTMEDLEGAVKDFEKKDAADVLEGLKLLAGAVKTFPDALRECKAVESDIAQILNALKQLSSPSSFSYHVAKDLVVNGANIIHEIMTAVSDYRAQKWEDFGIQVGTALHKLIVGAHDKFREFENHFGKKYESEEERNRRIAIFTHNLENIKKLQKVEEGSATYSHVTPFADLTPEEFSKRNGFMPFVQDKSAVAPLLETLDVLNLPDSFDWREKGAVNPVKNQEQCGSCWAFATVANIEGAGFVANKKLVSLSEQELVDCDKKTGDIGCGGGLPSNAYTDMIQNNIGLETEAAYPYVAKDGQCKASTSAEKAFITGYKNISTDEDQIAAALVQYGPLAIGINAGPMQWYGGGVANPWSILCNPKSLDHGVAIVGFGVDKGKKYWTIRNSWGATWGEKGYYRIIRGTGKCGLNTMVTTATGISFKGASSVDDVVV